MGLNAEQYKTNCCAGRGILALKLFDFMGNTLGR